MAITDELREWFDRYTMRKDVYDELTAIADRIDAEHKRAITSVMNDALYHANDKDMADLGWYRAVDAGKEVIHADDELFWNEGGDSAGRVTAIGVGKRAGWVWVMEDGCKVSIGHKASKLRHHHAPTVEDVLHEFICDHEEGVRDEADLIAEYAAKLRLAGGDE